MLTYSRTFMKSICFNAPVMKQFVQNVKNRLKRAVLKHSGLKRKHRAGWMVAYRRKNIGRMQIPAVISTNVRSLQGKMAELSAYLSQEKHRNTGVIMLQESWLHTELDNEIIQLEGYNLFRADRPVKFRNRGGGVITYVKSEWCCSTHVRFEFSSSNINCLVVECKPRFLSNYRSIIFGNIYIAPSTSVTDLSVFADSISDAVSAYLDHSLFIFAGDLNRSDTFFITSLGLTNTVNFPTRLDAQLDYVFVNDTNIFATRRSAPLGSSDHCVVSLVPKVYSKVNKRSNIRKPRRRLNEGTLRKRTSIH
jgi:hypothetical protein